MSEVQRWVVVAPDEDRLAGGPYLWDGVSVWVPPVSGWLVLESEWLARQPLPEQPAAPE